VDLSDARGEAIRVAYLAGDRFWAVGQLVPACASSAFRFAAPGYPPRCYRQMCTCKGCRTKDGDCSARARPLGMPVHAGDEWPGELEPDLAYNGRLASVLRPAARGRADTAMAARNGVAMARRLRQPGPWTAGPV